MAALQSGRRVAACLGAIVAMALIGPLMTAGPALAEDRGADPSRFAAVAGASVGSPEIRRGAFATDLVRLCAERYARRGSFVGAFDNVAGVQPVSSLDPVSAERRFGWGRRAPAEAFMDAEQGVYAIAERDLCQVAAVEPDPATARYLLPEAVEPLAEWPIFFPLSGDRRAVEFYGRRNQLFRIGMIYNGVRMPGPPGPERRLERGVTLVLRAL